MKEIGIFLGFLHTKFKEASKYQERGSNITDITSTTFNHHHILSIYHYFPPHPKGMYNFEINFHSIFLFWYVASHSIYNLKYLHLLYVFYITEWYNNIVV